MPNTPTPPRPMNPRRLPPRLFAAAALLTACTVASAPADVVILKDGFVIQGNVTKELMTITDPATGALFKVPKGNGFDLVDDGPRVVIFSSHHKQLGEINKDVKIRPDYKGYTNHITARKSNHRLPQMGAIGNPPDFNDKWWRRLEVKVPGGFEWVEQQIDYIDPYKCFVTSPTHLWRQGYRTSEMDPQKVRRLLSKHPDLAEPDGKPDPLKRVAIARFMKDAGWLALAKEEVERLKKEFTGEMSREAQEQFDRLVRELDVATAELVATEAELAIAAGRYRYAADLLAAFPDKTADPKDVDRATRVMAQVKTAREQYDHGRRLLRATVDEATGDGAARPQVAVGGGPVMAVWPGKAATPQLAALAAAAEVVLAEVHPDSAGRLEFFVQMALQVERERAAGQPASKKPEELLATAVSGWARGKGGATPLPDPALRIWAARESVLAFQRAGTLNERNTALNRYRQRSQIGPDELVQVISLLPPADPETDLERPGTPVPVGPNVPPRVFRRKTGSTSLHPSGMEYALRLPPEYHHGRAYPVIFALAYPGVDPEQMMGPLHREADRHGYILVAPKWTQPFDGKGGWQWRGEDHDYVTGVLRDVVRHFTVDNDRVFLVGAGDGANMAIDVGVSHPDLFAGVVAVGPNPKWQGMLIEYWQNAQKLPFYIATGEMAGASFQNLRLLFERWMPQGFPALLTVYKGRGIDWYPAETPVMFDWMGRKKRPGPGTTLKIGTGPVLEWRTMRETDNRFYWLGADRIAPGNLVDPNQPTRNVFPAGLSADIRGNNLIDLRTRGVREVTVWLNRDMIDWTKPVRVQLNGAAPYGWKPKVLEPDVGVLLEDYWQRGDRRMLFLGKLEFQSAS